MKSDKSRIIRRNSKGAPLTTAEMDTNLKEIMNVIDDVTDVNTDANGYLAQAVDARDQSIYYADTAASSAAVASSVLGTADIYATTAAGLAATTDGQYFSVVSADSKEYLILYLNAAGSAVEQRRFPSSTSIAEVNEYMRTVLRFQEIDGVAVAMTDDAGTRTWLEADDVYGGPTQLSLDHLDRTMGVSLFNDAYGYSLVATDAQGKMLELAYDDVTGQVSEWVMKRWAARLSPMMGSVDTYPRTAHNNIANMRKTRMKFSQLRAGDSQTQLAIGFIGDSYTAGHAYYLRELTKSLAKEYGFAGPGYIGFNHGPSLGDSNFQYNTSNAAYFGGSWTVSNLGTASPDNRTITAGAVGDYIGIQAVETSTISTLINNAKLMYLGDGTNPVIRYRWSDSDAWNELTLTGTGVQSLAFPFITSTTNWKFRLEVVSGLPTLFGIYATNNTNGIICSKMAASGSATGDWYKPQDAAWMAQWKASMSLIPCDCYMIMLGGNDQGASVVPSTMLANIQGIVAALKEINPSADIHITVRQDTSRTSTYPMSDYAAAVRTWAWTQKLPCSDMQFAFGTDPTVYASTGAFPLIDTDNTHPVTTTGGRLITEFFYRLLRSAQ